MKYRVLVSPRAASELEAAYHWIAAEAPESAVRWYNGFLRALESLQQNPQRCSIASEGRSFSTEIRQLLYGRQRSYRALFVIRDDSVVVLHIRHTSRRDADPGDVT